MKLNTVAPGPAFMPGEEGEIANAIAVPTPGI